MGKKEISTRAQIVVKQIQEKEITGGRSLVIRERGGLRDEEKKNEGNGDQRVLSSVVGRENGKNSPLEQKCSRN